MSKFSRFFSGQYCSTQVVLRKSKVDFGFFCASALQTARFQKLIRPRTFMRLCKQGVSGNMHPEFGDGQQRKQESIMINLASNRGFRLMRQSSRVDRLATLAGSNSWPWRTPGQLIRGQSL
jgi:hypothetical protein